MNEYGNEMHEAEFDYACAAVKVAMSSFYEICQIEGYASDTLKFAFEYAINAIDGLREQ